MEADSDYEDADSDEEDDEDDHYDAEYSKPILDKIRDNKNLKENICYNKDNKEEGEASDDELVLKSTQDPNSLKQARKDKLREKRDKEAEKNNNNKDYDPNKIEIVPQSDVS